MVGNLTIPFLLPILAAAVAVTVLGLALAALGRARSGRRHGRLETVDIGSGATLRSVRFRLAGRPDEIRRLADGSAVPVELKSRRAPRGGPLASHRVQVLAYCLLLEEIERIRPRYGLLRYADGKEFRVPWDAEARREILEVRAAIDRPYRGEATPSIPRCRRCPWVDSCDARAI